MSATLLTVDAGSSSVKLAAYTVRALDDAASVGRDKSVGVHDSQTPQRIAQSQASLSDGEEPASFDRQLDRFIAQNAIKEVRAVAHRIVHGGMKFSGSRILDEDAQEELARLTQLAPLHMPIALEWIRLCRARFGPSVPQIAVFDTAFFADLPDVARHYAIPLDLQKAHDVRRFGFHGLAHASMLRQVRDLRPDLDRGGRLITIQLGAGCSIAAIDRGAPLDTSMGFSPLEGLVMATRAGDIDAGLVTFLERRAGFNAESLERLLNSQSGLLGVSGVSADMRVLLESKSRDSELAIDLYCYRVRKYIGAYLTVLGGADAIAIGGGVGENSPEIRRRILDDMEWCGVTLDGEKNADAREREDSSERISKSGGTVDVWVIAVDEGAEMAREAISVLGVTELWRSQRQPLSST